MILESGACNVCSAPCSSCMHVNHALMGTKAEESLDENCRIGEASSKCSMDEGNLSSLRSRACESSQHAVSETSNMLSVNSSHDSLSENAESRQTLSNKHPDSKYIEGHDDDTSCVSRASDSDLENNHQMHAERINIGCSSASVSPLGAEGSESAPSIDMSSLFEVPSSKDAEGDPCSLISGKPRFKHSEGNPCSLIPEKFSECSSDNSNSSLTKETSTIVDSGDKSISNKNSLIDGTAKVSPKVVPKSEVDTNNVGDAKKDGCNFSVKDEQHEKTEQLIKSPFKQELQYENESDESDVVEHDVKVCDICGDAGREDLLAICSRCSDGAEHTYCMREMLQKVPQGDWFCEECKYAEENENQRLGVEEKKVLKVGSSSQASSKRLSENIEVASTPKRQALESSTGSPKASSPKRLASLSRESSFKNLDKGKVKPGKVMPIRGHSGDDIEIVRSPSIGPRSQTPKSTLLKCKSFNNFNSKPRVKLVDEVVPPKLKGGGEHISKNMEMPARMTGKSTLFKSSSLGRSSVAESECKMVSRKSATGQELKESRLLKESNAYYRKFPSRIDRSVVSSPKDSSVVSVAKGDQKLTSRGETTKPSAVNNKHELKVNQNGKLTALSKSMSNGSWKVLEPQVSSEGTSTSVDEALQDVLPRLQETANRVEKTSGRSVDRVKPVIITASKSSFCQKCEEYGHVLEHCTAGSTHDRGAEVSITASSSSKEEMHTGNRLKAAIQAAFLRRPDIYKKKEVPNQTDVSISSTYLNCEVSSEDQLMASSTSKNSISAEENHQQQEFLENSTSDSSKCLSVNNSKQHNSCKTDFYSKPRKSDSIDLSTAKHVQRESSNKALAVPSVPPNMSVFPEYKYIWQGVFEVHRNGKPPDFCAGFQAHLSSCASPKVLGAVNKFLPKVSLNEVPRLSTWPSQFHQDGAGEDHIALYFFAKDVDSYDRHYKGLLDHMIRNDLALKGIFDDVELLIFPSNQLPENSQRWNMFFFLWGVFRGRRNNQSDSTKKICIPSLYAVPVEEESSTASETPSEMHCSPKHKDEESIASDKVCSTLLPSTSVDQDRITESRTTEVSEKANILEHGQGRDSKPPEAMGTSVGSLLVETKVDFDISVKKEKAWSPGVPSVGSQERDTTSPISKDSVPGRTNSDEDQQRPMRKRKDDDHYIDLEATLVNQETGAESNTQDKISERMTGDKDLQMPKRKLKGDEHYIDLEAPLGNQETGTNDKIPVRTNGSEDQQGPKRKQNHDNYIDLEAAVDNDETGVASNICVDKILGRTGCDEDKKWPEMKQKGDHYIDLEETFEGDTTVVAINCQLSNDKQVQYLDLSDTVLQASAVICQKRPSAVSCQKRPWYEVNGKLEDEGSSSKKPKTGFNRIYGCYGSEGRDSLNAARDDKVNSEDLGTIERTFFPVNMKNITESHLVFNSMSLKGTHDRFQVGIPNLELALGGETKQGQTPPPPPPKGMHPFFVGAVDRKNSQEIHPDGLIDGQEDDDGAAASLSLSLSFTSSNKEQHTQPAPKTQVFSDGHHVNTPFLLFGKYTDK